MKMQRLTSIVLTAVAAVLAYSVTQGQQATPQAPHVVAQKLIIMTGEPIQFHVKGVPGTGRQIWPGQMVRVDEETRIADLIVWNPLKRVWEEHHQINLDAGDEVYYTLFR